MIRRLEIEDIVKIMNLKNDNIENICSCDKGEWVQWLISQIDNPHLFIIGDIVEDKINSYLVAFSSVVPPVSYKVSVIMFFSSGNIDSNMALRNILNEWAKNKGATEITFLIKDEASLRVLSKYGAVQTGIIAGWKING